MPAALSSTPAMLPEIEALHSSHRGYQGTHDNVIGLMNKDQKWIRRKNAEFLEKLLTI